MRPHPIAKCSKTLASNASAAPLDVVKMKSVLGALGHYEAPEWGVSQFPDAALFAAIKHFQKSQGLKVDGAIKPDGETEAALSHALSPRHATTALQNTAQALQAMGRGGDELLAHITREEAALLHNVTDGATINPRTGLLEFWHDYESEAAGVGDYGKNSGPDRDNDRGGDGQDQNTSDNTAGNDTTDNGDPPQNDSNNDGDDLGRGADDQDKSQDRARRASAKEGTLAGNRGFLDTTPDDDEDAQDWAPDLLGDDVSVPQTAPAADPNAPKDDKPNPAPKTDGGQKKGGLSLAGFFGNMAEDLGSIFSGNVTSHHSAYDVRNANAMADKYGYFPKDADRKAPWLRGGQYGPGGGSYSPSELHNAGINAQATRNASPSTTGARRQNIGNPGALTHPKDNYMYWSEDEDLVDVPDLTIPDPQKENRQRMAAIDKARQRTQRGVERMKELAQAKGAPRPGQFPKNGLTFTDNWANELIAGKALATTPPQDGLLGRTPEKVMNVEKQPATQKTSKAPSGPVNTGTLVNLDSFAKWRDANLGADVNKRKTEMRRNISNQILEVQSVKQQRAKIQNDLEKAIAAAHPLEDAYYGGALVEAGVKTGAGVVTGAIRGGASGAVIEGGTAALTSAGKVYDAGSMLSEKRDEIESISRSLTWMENYEKKEIEKLLSYYDELEQME